MESAIYENVQNIAVLLQQTFAAKDNIEQKEAEKMLISLSGNEIFINSLIKILMQPDKFNVNIQDSAAIYINTVVRTLISKKGTSGTSLESVCESIVLAIHQKAINLKHKIQISSALTMVLQMEKGMGAKNISQLMEKHNFSFFSSNKIICDDPSINLAVQVKSKIFEFTSNWMASGEIHEVIAALLCFQSLIQSTKDGEKIEQMWVGLREKFYKISEMLIGGLAGIFSALGTQIVTGAEAISDSDIVEINDRIAILVTWANVLQSLLTQTFQVRMNKDRAMRFSQRQEIPILIVSALCLTIQTQHQIPDCLISTSGINEKIDTGLNEFQTILMKAYNKLNNSCFDQRPQFDVKKSQFFALLDQLIPACMKTVLLFCTCFGKHLDTAMEQNKNEELFVEIMKFISSCCSQSEFYKIYAEYYQPIFMDVILPLLRTSKTEISLMVDSPSEFVSLASDTVDKQMSETFKTSAASLLEAFIDHIDGALSFIVTLAIIILQFSIESNSIQEIETKYIGLSEMKKKVFFELTPQDIRVETCLMTLTIASYILPKRNDLLGMLEEVVKENITFFFNNSLTAIINYLLQTTGNQSNEEMALAKSGAEALETLISDEDNIPRIINVLPEIYTNLLKSIPTTEQHQYFDIIHSIFSFKAYLKKLAENHKLIIDGMEILVGRVKTELALNESGQRTSQLFINRCWNIIRAICQKEEFSQFLLKIEQVLLPLYEYMTDPTKIDFDEDILLLLNSTINQLKRVNDNIWKIVPHLYKVFQKNHFMLGHVFPVLNSLIFYGGENVKQTEFINLVLEFAFKAIETVSDKNNIADRSEGALLIQLLIEKSYESINDEHWISILQTCINVIQSQKSKKNFFRIRLMNVIILALAAKFQLTQEILHQLDNLDYVVTEIVQCVEQIKLNYDLKTYVIGVSTIFISQPMADSISNQLPQLLECLIKALHKQEKLQQKKNNQKQVDDSDNDDDDDDDYDEDDDDDSDGDDSDESLQGQEEKQSKIQTNCPNFYLLITENFSHLPLEIIRTTCSRLNKINQLFLSFSQPQYQDRLTMDSLISDILSKDEFQFFKQMVILFHQSSPDILKSYVNKLSQNNQAYLKDALKMERVKVSSSIDAETVPRQIYRVKK